MQQPILTTERLILRPFTLADAPEVQRLLGAWEIVRTTFVPHPYENGMAEAWISTHPSEWQSGRLACFAITERASQALVGSIRLGINAQHARGEFGFWLGVLFWNRGYMTEAAQSLVDYGFEMLELQRIQANHVGGNAASGRVMQKLGMQPEGVSRRAVLRFGERQDLVNYAILRDEWLALKG